MRGRNQRPHQEGNGSRTASHVVYTPPRDTFFSLFSCPDKITQQSHIYEAKLLTTCAKGSDASNS